ncbi:hypothetical protein SCHPADRAFT_896419 [Schizopora paradoxa]|uniref:C2H2-type domain-containing protein n=1 Tax=Schizopora paradoxa TaxID=27342 RepID=A0A0H2RKA9_9AGAM|nr:hypothetical protein SCHPADRAFT_896419 [Schizopora paradoxa]
MPLSLVDGVVPSTPCPFCDASFAERFSIISHFAARHSSIAIIITSVSHETIKASFSVQLFSAEGNTFHPPTAFQSHLDLVEGARVILPRELTKFQKRLVETRTVMIKAVPDLEFHLYPNWALPAGVFLESLGDEGGTARETRLTSFEDPKLNVTAPDVVSLSEFEEIDLAIKEWFDNVEEDVEDEADVESDSDSDWEKEDDLLVPVI